MNDVPQVIGDAKARFDAEGPEAQARTKQTAASHLERYFYLLLFAMYLKDLKEGRLTPEPAAVPEGGYSHTHTHTHNHTHILIYT
jgi:hypothetical protein